MADAENAAPAAPSAPADVSMTASSAAVESAQPIADPKPEGKATKTEDGDEKPDVDGMSNEQQDRRKKRNDRKKERPGKGHGANGLAKNYRNHNNKRRNEEFDNLPETDDPVKIRGQVEFYFSLHNLATDTHMFQQIEGPKNKPVPIKHLMTFKRMRRFQPYTAVVNALKDSDVVYVLQGGDFSQPGDEAVQRLDPLVIPAKEGDDKKPPSIMELYYRLHADVVNNMTASAYVKGFSTGFPDIEPPTQIELEEFFRPYGAVMVRQRREDDGAFKGSVFVDFDSGMSQKQFLLLDPPPKFQDCSLTTMGKKEYIVMKCKEKGIKPDWELTPQEAYEKRKQRRKEKGFRVNDDKRVGDKYSGRGQRRSELRNRKRSRSPRGRRERSASEGSVDSRDWNTRRDRFKNGKDDRGSRKEEREEVDRDAHGVPTVKASRTEAELATPSKKRKVTDEDRDSSPKKSKLEIKEDE